MSARRKPPPPTHRNVEHQYVGHAGLTHDRDAAGRHAWDALARYKFVMFGYWCGIRVHLNRLCSRPEPNPWRELVATARRRRRTHDEDCTTHRGRP